MTLFEFILQEKHFNPLSVLFFLLDFFVILWYTYSNVKFLWGEFNMALLQGSSYVLPKPKTPEEQMVHLCDYLASRKYLEFKF